jgi:5-methyltetrahydrofolate--homocysteine methyltransferase
MIDNPVIEPPFIGTRVVPRISLDEIVGYVNEQELFRTQWHMEPSDDESEPAFRRRMRQVFQEQLTSARKQELFVPQVAYGYFPANSEGNDVIIWDDDSRTGEQARLSFPRQKEAPRISVADYVKPAGERDFVALQIVTMGSRVSSRVIAHYAGATRESYLRHLGFGMFLLDAIAEYWHRRIRIEWNLADEDGPSLRLLFNGFYRGARYPLAGNEAAVAGLLGSDRIGVSTGVPDCLEPELSRAALIVHHPQASGAV